MEREKYQPTPFEQEVGVFDKAHQAGKVFRDIKKAAKRPPEHPRVAPAPAVVVPPDSARVKTPEPAREAKAEKIKLTPDQRASLREIVSEKLVEEMTQVLRAKYPDMEDATIEANAKYFAGKNFDEALQQALDGLNAE